MDMASPAGSLPEWSPLASAPSLDNLGKGEKEEKEEQQRMMEERAEADVEDCGTCFTKLPFLNIFRSPRWFLVFLSLAACVQGAIVNGLVNVVIATIEQKFGMTSSQSGVIVASQDVGSLLVMLPASHLGGRLGSSKPRWIAAGMVIIGLGSLTWTIPHFITSSYKGAHGSPLCNTTETLEDKCSGETSGSLGHQAVFIISQFLVGVGCSPLLSLGTTFMDESVSGKSSPVYIGIFQMWLVIGPALGSVMGGSFLRSRSSAWWPGFLITGVIALFSAAAIHLYPPRIRSKKETDKRPNEAEAASFLETMRSLLTNPDYLLLALASGGDGAIISSYGAFFPKFIEQQYGLSKGKAAQVVGMIVVPAGGLGTFLGGWIVKRFQLTRSKIILMFIVIQLITLPLLLSFLLVCPGLSFAGPSTSTTFPMEAACTNMTSTCYCPSYDPVCGSDGLTHYSPCHAGCSTIDSKHTFSNCSCVQGGTVQRSSCKSKCNYLVPFITVTFVVVFLIFLTLAPMAIACLRSVAASEGSLAIGLQVCLARLAGAIPGPVVFGAFLDQTCSTWIQSCGECPL